MKRALPLALSALALLLVTAACHREEKLEAPTPAETARLNEAEDMLDNLAADEEGAAPEGTAPNSGINSSGGAGGK